MLLFWIKLKKYTSNWYDDNFGFFVMLFGIGILAFATVLAILILR